MKKISRLPAHKSMQLSFESSLVMQKPSTQKSKNQNLTPEIIEDLLDLENHQANNPTLLLKE